MSQKGQQETDAPRQIGRGSPDAPRLRGVVFLRGSYLQGGSVLARRWHHISQYLPSPDFMQSEAQVFEL